jgi:hypothetical protein
VRSVAGAVAIDNQQRGEWCYVGGELSERDSLWARAVGRWNAVVVESCGCRMRGSRGQGQGQGREDEDEYEY